MSSKSDAMPIGGEVCAPSLRGRGRGPSVAETGDEDGNMWSRRAAEMHAARAEQIDRRPARQSHRTGSRRMQVRAYRA